MVNHDTAMEARLKYLEGQIAYLQNKMLEQSYKINVLALYVANTPCCTPDRYGSLVFKDDVGGVIGIAEPQFIREARRHGNGFAC